MKLKIPQILLWIGAAGAIAFTLFLAGLTFTMGAFLEPIGIAWIACLVASAIAAERAFRTAALSRRLALLGFIIGIALLQMSVIVVTA